MSDKSIRDSFPRPDKDALSVHPDWNVFDAPRAQQAGPKVQQAEATRQPEPIPTQQRPNNDFIQIGVGVGAANESVRPTNQWNPGPGRPDYRSYVNEHPHSDNYYDKVAVRNATSAIGSGLFSVGVLMSRRAPTIGALGYLGAVIGLGTSLALSVDLAMEKRDRT